MNDSLISEISLYKLDIRADAPFRISLGLIESWPNLLVRITTRDGLYGLGEGSPVSFITGETQDVGLEMAHAMARLLLGKDSLAIGPLLHLLDAFVVGSPTVKSAFDMALYDLAAKRVGLPLYAFLGGEKRAFYTNFAMGLDTPQAMADRAVRYKEMGALVIKVKLGTNRSDDVDRIRAIRRAIGDEIDLRLDANQGWDVPTAVAIVQALAPYNIQVCEEPVAHWNNQGLAHVRRHSPIPIMADESVFDHHDAYRLACMGACDYFNIKFAKSGGIHNGLKINAVGEAAGIPCMMGQMGEGRIGVSAQAHFVCACRNILFVDIDSVLHQVDDPVIGGVQFEGPHVVVPDTPGHGADLDPAYLESLQNICIRA